MYKLVTNDSLIHPLMALPFESQLEVKGINTSVICIPFGEEYDTIKKIRNIVDDPVKMSVIHVYDGNQMVAEYKDYLNLQQITTAKYDVNGEEVEVLMAKISRESTIPEQINELKELVKKTEEEKAKLERDYADFKQKTTDDLANTKNAAQDAVDTVAGFVDTTGLTLDNIVKENEAINEKISEVKNSQNEVAQMANQSVRTAETLSQNLQEFSDNVNRNFETLSENEAMRNEAISNVENAVNELHIEVKGMNEEDMDLDQLKEHRILKSKENLRNYLSVTTVTSDVHGGVPADYSITEEKQTQLMAMVMMASMNPEYQPSWNAKGEPCSYNWTVDELKMLAAQIEAVVRPLVSKQQHMENDIRNATTIDEVKDVIITF